MLLFYINYYYYFYKKKILGWDYNPISKKYDNLSFKKYNKIKKRINTKNDFWNPN